MGERHGGAQESAKNAATTHGASDHGPHHPAGHHAHGPGEAQLDALLWQGGGAPRPEAVAEILAEFPKDRGAMIGLLQKALGNTFVQSVLKVEGLSESFARVDGRSNHGQTSLPPLAQRRTHQPTPGEVAATGKAPATTAHDSAVLSDREAEANAGSSAQIISAMHGRIGTWETQLPELLAWSKRPGDDAARQNMARTLAAMLSDGEMLQHMLFSLQRDSDELQAQAQQAGKAAEAARIQAEKSAMEARWAVRFLGVMQTAGGLAEMLFACPLAETGLGAVACIQGAATAVAGSQQAWQGAPQQTQTAKAVAGAASLVVDKETAEKIGSYSDLALGVGSQLALLRRVLGLGTKLSTVAATESTAATTAVELTVEQQHLIVEGEAAVVRGEMHAAVATFDRLEASGMAAAKVREMEAAVAAKYSKTPISAYRNPSAMVNGKSVAPTAWGGKRYYGTDALAPEQVFNEGLPARGPNLDLQMHAEGAADTAFRGTCTMPMTPDAETGAAAWAGEGGWVYEIDSAATWDVNASLEGRVRSFGRFRGNLVPGENEHAMLAGVPRERIVGAYPISANGNKFARGPLVPNPNYTPGR